MNQWEKGPCRIYVPFSGSGSFIFPQMYLRNCNQFAILIEKSNPGFQFINGDTMICVLGGLQFDKEVRTLSSYLASFTTWTIRQAAAGSRVSTLNLHCNSCTFYMHIQRRIVKE